MEGMSEQIIDLDYYVLVISSRIIISHSASKVYRIDLTFMKFS